MGPCTGWGPQTCSLIFNWAWLLLWPNPISDFCVQIPLCVRMWSPVPDGRKTADTHRETHKRRNGLINNFPKSSLAQSARSWAEEPYLLSWPLWPVAKIPELNDLIWRKLLDLNKYCSPLRYCCHFVWGMQTLVWDDGGSAVDEQMHTGHVAID